MPADERAVLEGIDPARMPRHVAIIMDGNGRWAQQRGEPREAGHRAGAKAVRNVVTRARELGIPYLTLYAFSAQNWQRPKTEIDELMMLLTEFCDKERNLLMDKEIQFRVIGQRSRLPLEARIAVKALEAVTSQNNGMQLIIALSYGGREEIVEVMRSLAAEVKDGRLRPEDVDEEEIARKLWTAGIPDPDVVIRTSGELRVSNFLLWQIAYAEFVVDHRFWPDFDTQAFDEALKNYATRNRRFGGLEQDGDTEA
jgi:undecaprenyl diphosphate synthase